MSKRDDLGSDSKSTKRAMGLFVGTIAMGAIKLIAQNKKKKDLSQKISFKDSEINGIDRQISNEQAKGFFRRDENKINSLNQERNKKINERNDLMNKYNKF